MIRKANRPAQSRDLVFGVESRNAEFAWRGRSSPRSSNVRPVVKTRVTSPRKRVVAGSNPAADFMPV